MARAPEVVLVGGEDASGLASMLADLLSENLRDFPGRARVAARSRGSVVLQAADYGIDVTVSFLPGRVEISDGAQAGVTMIAGDWLSMAQLCSGQLSPVSAVRRRELSVQPGSNLAAAAAAGYVLSVPNSFYEQREGEGGPDAEPSTPTQLRTIVLVVLIVALAALVGGVVVHRRRQRVA